MGAPDVLMRGLENLWVFTPQTPQAKAWIKDNFQPEGLLARDWDGGGFAISKDSDALEKFLTSGLTFGGSHD
jgi:hypothetical protein